MKKKLKIKFWKSEKALAMQILEQEGLPKRKEKGTVHIINCPALKANTISLRGNQHLDDFNLNCWYFENNSERDEYLDKMVNAITDELFILDDRGDVKVGEICEFRDKIDEKWQVRKLLAILPPHIDMPFIVERPQDNTWTENWRYARPYYKRIEPKIEECGEIITYTWDYDYCMLCNRFR